MGWIKRWFCSHKRNTTREGRLVEHLYADTNLLMTYFKCHDCGFVYGTPRRPKCQPGNRTL